ncbi:Tubulin-specific chaperone E [Cyphellophora attinorum]|uniref:Tubulin-specific chaperone E n=1 Tax=Cyphellophora attinorum TaxID=1664694 RepID=A0A0N1HWF4_9EURO|nr:Tubulin-specific chaperone E [Phialophora attinorum]KPI41945.1 Tubulin-specific chaperone E [Phialophora attinorum]
MSSYVGQRLAFDGNLCTVRYVGPLDNTQGLWLGVEWDDTTRGKHDGTYKGQRIFSCLSSAPTPASFIRPTRTPDKTRTVLEAIKYKYDQATHENGSLKGPGYQIIEISKKKVEEVGFDKITQQMSKLENLKIALIDQLGVAGLQTPDAVTDDLNDAQQRLSSTCPNISELDLGWNLFESWQDIIDACAPLRSLRVLKCDGLRLRSLESTQQLPSITELHLNSCLLRPVDVLALLSVGDKPVFPNLRTLWISHNELDSFNVPARRLVFSSVTNLVVENNNFDNLADVARICQHFPNVESLSVQDNLISSTGSKTLLSSTLKSLNLASNNITDFSFIDSLPSLFPVLTSLRISRNPLYERLATAPPSTTSDPVPDRPGRASDAPFYLILARIPNLQTLNYTTITPRDREEGEIYYLSLADKDIRATHPGKAPETKREHITDFETKYPLYNHLAASYDRPNLLTISSSDPAFLNAPKPTDINFAAKASLAARLVTATFYIASDNEQTLTRPLPTTLPVYTLKSLLARHFHLPPLQFTLVYESADELDPEQVTTTKLWGSSKEAWVEWGVWDVDVGPPRSSGENAGKSGEGDRGHEGNEEEREDEGEWIENGKVLLRGGTRWRRREVEIVDGWRGWGDYLDGVGGGSEVRVRVEPFDRASQ